MSNPNTVSSLSDKLFPSLRLTYPPHPSTFPNLTAEISDLQLHPTIEAVLHLANADLPSAHFLVRHMQASPAVEGMLLHGILHRAEGDFNNARAWIGDVKDACEGYVPKKRDEGQKLDTAVFERIKSGREGEGTLISFVYGESDPLDLINDVEALRKKKSGQRGENEEEEIGKRIRNELEKVLEWCKRKFGETEWRDATKAWVKNSDEIREISNEMTSGDKGFRKF